MILKNKDTSVTAVIFAGGVGRRMHSKDLPKQFLRIHGKPIIAWTIGVFEKTPRIDNVVVVCNANWLDYCQSIISEFSLNKVRAVVAGGSAPHPQRPFGRSETIRPEEDGSTHSRWRSSSHRCRHHRAQRGLGGGVWLLHHMR